MKRFTIIATLVALAATTLFAADSLLGRDLVDRGSRATISGTLIEENGEWSLRAADGTYAVHLGNYAVVYPKGIDLREGDEATVEGFLVGEDISAVRLSTMGRSYEFRSDDGTPLWSGRGNRRNAVATAPGAGLGAGTGAGLGTGRAR